MRGQYKVYSSTVLPSNLSIKESSLYIISKNNELLDNK
jgi:hypothetical protein